MPILPRRAPSLIKVFIALRPTANYYHASGTLCFILSFPLQRALLLGLKSPCRLLKLVANASPQPNIYTGLCKYDYGFFSKMSFKIQVSL